MIKAFGVLVLVGCVAGFALVTGGYLDGDVKVNVTDQGRSTVNSGIDATGRGVTNGLNHFKMNQPHIAPDMEIQPKK
jgi:hypothetical protein